MIDDDDEAIRLAFEAITPQHLIRSTSATSTRDKTQEVELRFDVWATDMTGQVMLTWSERAEQLSTTPQAILLVELESPQEARSFAPDHDESMQQFFQRLRREALALGAYRLALGMVSPAAVGDPKIDLLNDDAVAQAVRQGVLTRHLVAYSAQVDGAESLVLWPLSGGRVGASFTGGALSPMLRSVLRGP